MSWVLFILMPHAYLVLGGNRGFVGFDLKVTNYTTFREWAVDLIKKAVGLLFFRLLQTPKLSVYLPGPRMGNLGPCT